MTFDLGRRPALSQEGHGEDGETDRANRADSGGDVQPSRKSHSSGVDERGTNFARKLTGYFEGPAECVSRGVRCFEWNPSRDLAGHRAPIDGHPDAAEDGDPECPAELGSRLRDPRRGPGSLGRCGSDDQVVRQREYGSVATRFVPVVSFWTGSNAYRAPEIGLSGSSLFLRSPLGSRQSQA
jgi:hypothetical protein